MVYIRRSDNVQEWTWEVGQERPALHFATTSEPTRARPFHDVNFLHASGKELTYIRRRFTNLPDAMGHQMIWRGKWAQFIYDNLIGDLT